MATQNPLLPPGTYVQINAATESPRAAAPSPAERTIGIIRQSFTAFDGPYYQVVWNPGSMHPETGLYHNSDLTQLNQQQVQEITQQLAAGTYQIPAQMPTGTQYKQPNIPVEAAPPQPPYQRGAF